MPLSTSSSDHGFHVREVPTKPWLHMLATVALVVTAGFGAWETEVRGMGYGPTCADTPNLWAERRALASGVGPEQVVFTGASRTLFDMDLEVFRELVGGPLPIQLATVGSNPKVVLADLAADPTYAGTTIVGIVPPLLAAGGGPPIAMPTRYVEHYAKRSRADITDLQMALWLQERLAFLNNSDLSLAALIDHGLDLPPREGVYAPKIPGYLATLDRVRQARMVDRLANDPQEMHEVQQIWIPLFSPLPKPSVFTDEQWAKMMSDGVDANMASMVASVRAITARGGRVIFQRLPSTGTVLELENRYAPRELVWDRLLRETGAPGIYFEDYPELRGFDCPEWSHLTAADAVEYTRRFARVLQREGLL
jgi:hypothetical protein